MKHFQIYVFIHFRNVSPRFTIINFSSIILYMRDLYAYYLFKFNFYSNSFIPQFFGEEKLTQASIKKML